MSVIDLEGRAAQGHRHVARGPRRHRRVNQPGRHARARGQPRRWHGLRVHHQRQDCHARRCRRTLAIPIADLACPSSRPTASARSSRAITITRYRCCRSPATRSKYTKRDVSANLRPYGIEISPKGDAAYVANIGNGPTGSVDTISVLDLTFDTPRMVDSVAVGIVPEGIALSPDGTFLAVNVMNGSNVPKTAGWYHDFGILKIMRAKGTNSDTAHAERTSLATGARARRGAGIRKRFWCSAWWKRRSSSTASTGRRSRRRDRSRSTAARRDYGQRIDRPRRLTAEHAEFAETTALISAAPPPTG